MSIDDIKVTLTVPGISMNQGFTFINPSKHPLPIFPAWGESLGMGKNNPVILEFNETINLKITRSWKSLWLKKCWKFKKKAAS